MFPNWNKTRNTHIQEAQRTKPRHSPDYLKAVIESKPKSSERKKTYHIYKNKNDNRILIGNYLSQKTMQ